MNNQTVLTATALGFLAGLLIGLASCSAPTCPTPTSLTQEYQ